MKKALTNLLEPKAEKGSLLKELGVGKLVAKALEVPDAKPDELLKGSNAAYEQRIKLKQKNKT